jgi:hypothetical protein
MASYLKKVFVDREILEFKFNLPTVSPDPEFAPEKRLGEMTVFKKKFNEFIKVGAACISMHIMAAH